LTLELAAIGPAEFALAVKHSSAKLSNVPRPITKLLATEAMGEVVFEVSLKL
jgi:hypothetical protein